MNKLSDAENERLALLLEECGEVIQIIGKIQRHGYDSHDPTDEGGPSNRKLLEREIADVVQAVDLLAGAEDIDPLSVATRLDLRWITVQEYLHYQPISLFSALPTYAKRMRR